MLASFQLRGSGLRKWIAAWAAFCLAAALYLPPASALPPQKIAGISAQAQKALQAGEKAEKLGDWQTAYTAYSEAAASAPKNGEIEVLRDLARFQLVQQHMDTAEREALAGRPDQAKAELRAAIALDPSYKVAGERLAQMEALESPRQPAKGSPLLAAAQLQTQPGVRTFDFRGDVRSAYEELAQRFGVTAHFDPDLPAGRPIRFRVPDASFETAMSVLGSETETFWVPLDEHNFLVAEDQQQKRRQYEPETVRTFLLPASASDSEMTETLRVLHDIAGIAHTSLNTGTRELTVRDTPNHVAMAGELMQQIEQGRGEMVLEIELLEVNRNSARQIGLVPPASQTVTPLTPQDVQEIKQATTSQQLLGIIQGIFGTTSGGGALGGLLPPLFAFGGGLSTFFTTLPGAQVDFSQTYSLVRSAQRILLRAEDGQPTTLFIGDHYPITLSLLSANLATSAFTQGALPRTDLLAGSMPSAVLNVSLRGNGQLDLVAANQGDNTISVFLGNGDGTFAPRTDISVGTAPVALAAADFNGDGKPDIAVVNQKDNTVTILYGNGDGTFFPGPTLTTGKNPSAILTAAFDASGHPDLAVANQADNTVSIFLNDGTGTFTAAASITTGNGPQALASADFNADGKADLAVVNQTDNTVSIFLGNGDGTFTAKSTVITGTTPTSVVATDFNADGRPDLAVTDQGANTVSIFLGNGDGTFSARTDFQSGAEPTAALTGDFNGDGIPDLITANFSDNTVSVLIGDGKGNFLNELTVPVGAGPVALTAADFNGDSRIDLAVAAQTGDVISVILNTASLPSSNPAQQTPYPGATYEDIGLKVKATPRIHPNGDVTLQLSFEISSLTGDSLNGIPIITNRTVEQTVRVREDEATLLSGIVDQEELAAISGFPGLAAIPGAGLAGGNQNVTKTDNELLIVITPRLLRQPPHPGRDIYAGTAAPGGPGVPQP